MARERTAPAALGGQLASVSLFDVCQFLMLNRKTGTLTVRSGTGVAYLTFNEGQLLTALDDALHDGEGVVLRAVQWKEGTFEFTVGPVPPERKIQASTESILLEAARKIDEMRERDREAGIDTDDAGVSKEAEFKETQRRAASLSEAFRAAVSVTPGSCAPGDFKESILNALSSGECTRVLLGPLGRITLVSAHETTRLEGTREEDLREWMDVLIPPEADRPGGDRSNGDRSSGDRLQGDRSRGDRSNGDRWNGDQSAGDRSSGSKLRLIDVQRGWRLWGKRLPSSAGDWISLRLAGSKFPKWDPTLFPESLRGELAAAGRPPLLVLEEGRDESETVRHPGRHLVAAHLAEMSRTRPRTCWIVESWPEFDWSLLQGPIESIQPARIQRPGALAELCEANGAHSVFIFDGTSPRVIRQAFELGEEGVQVTIVRSVAQGWNERGWNERAHGLGALAPQRPGTQGNPLFGGRLHAIWSVKGPSPSSAAWRFRRFSVPDGDGLAAHRAA